MLVLAVVVGRRRQHAVRRRRRPGDTHDAATPGSIEASSATTVPPGSARVYKLADGRRIVRFEDFEVSTNTDLFVWLSEAVTPRPTVEAQAAPRVSIGNLKSTLGSQNYDIRRTCPATGSATS